MARKVNHGGRGVGQKPLEQFVIGYLKRITSTSNKNSEIKFIEKSIALINQYLGIPCCYPGSVGSLITPHDNQLTITIKSAITNNSAIRRFFLLSLKRIVNLLNFYLYSCCTDNLVITFAGGAIPANYVLTITDLVSGDLIYQTLTTATSPITVALPAQYFGPAAAVQVCLNVVHYIGHVVNVTDVNHVPVVSANAAGVTCPTVVGPLSTAYTITQI
jgi:hypothetical protein